MRYKEIQEPDLEQTYALRKLLQTFAARDIWSGDLYLYMVETGREISPFAARHPIPPPVYGPSRLRSKLEAGMRLAIGGANAARASRRCRPSAGRRRVRR